MSTAQQGTPKQQAEALAKDWETNPRWKGLKRDYTADDVVRLRGSIQEEHTLARRGAEDVSVTKLTLPEETPKFFPNVVRLLACKRA